MSTIQTGDPALDPCLREFVQHQLERYSSYHDQKETMAYGGLTLFVGGAIAALLSDRWPPAWGEPAKWITLAGVTATWVAVRSFLVFQLHRRRWAALRVGGCERFLLRGLPGAPPCTVPPAAPKNDERDAVSRWIRLIDWFWPRKAAVRAFNRAEKAYPSSVEAEWRKQEIIGTEAMKHEFLVAAVGWTAYLALVLRTVLAN